MKSRLWLPFGACLVFVLSAGCGLPRPLRAIEGVWSMPGRQGTTRLEIWKAEDGAHFSGQGLRLHDADTTLLEYLDLHREKGQWVYTATVPDQNDGKPISFLQQMQSADEIVFVNPGHDFPQRIGYRFVPMASRKPPMPGDSMIVTVGTLTEIQGTLRFVRQ